MRPPHPGTQTLRLVGGLGLTAAVVAATCLYVTHREAGPLHTGPRLTERGAPQRTAEPPQRLP
ncbi:MAG: hypothetical protein JWM18_3372 [Chloroflexi bacterium]|jgi:hypothetical protein|nr:hypothetical protein [Chloroflexota bacterium]